MPPRTRVLLLLLAISPACSPPADDAAGGTDEGNGDGQDLGSTAGIDDASVTKQLALALTKGNEIILNPGTGKALWKLDWLVDQAVEMPGLYPTTQANEQCVASGSEHAVPLEPTREGRWALLDLPALDSYRGVVLQAKAEPFEQEAFAPVLCLTGGAKTEHLGVCLRGTVSTFDNASWGTVVLALRRDGHPDLWRLLDVAIFTSAENFDARSTGLPAHDSSKELRVSGGFFLTDPAARCPQ